MTSYLIWSNEHGGLWLPACHGYTLDIRDAGRYHKKDAGSIVLQAGAWGPDGIPNEVMLLAPEHRWDSPPRELCAGEELDRTEQLRLARSVFGLPT